MNIVSRAAWGARPAKKRTAFQKPAQELYCHHLAAEWHGAAGMRAAQRFHQDTRGWRDIAYTFLVDDDGTIYEGTGPDVLGTHTKGRNSRAMAICAMGDFDKRAPTPLMLASISWLIRHGVQQGWWRGLTGGHRDAPGASTACPGRFLYDRIPQLRAAAQVAGQEDDDMDPDTKRKIDELWDALVGNRRAREHDDRSQDLATPILTTNHIVVNELERKS